MCWLLFSNSGTAGTEMADRERPQKTASRILVTQPRWTTESAKLLTAEMERLGASSARAAVRLFDAREEIRYDSLLRRLFARRHR